MRKNKLLSKRYIGISVRNGCANVIYRLTWSDGSTTTEIGTTIYTIPGILNPLIPETYKPELATLIEIVSTALPAITEACLAADEARSKLKPEK